MTQVIQKNFKLLIITLLLLIVGGVFIFLNNPVEIKALENGDDAVDVFGQFYDGAVDYDTGYLNNGATEQSLNTPGDVLIDETNHFMYVADTAHSRVLVYTLSALNVLEDLDADYVLGQTDFRGSEDGGASATTISSPVGLAVHEVRNMLYVSDSTNNRVLVYDFGAGDPISTGRAADYVIGQSDLSSGTSGTSSTTLNTPMGLEIDDSNNRLFITDSGNNRVMVVDASFVSTGMAATWALGGVTDFNTVGDPDCNPYDVWNPVDVAWDSVTGLVYVVDNDRHRVMVYDFSQPGDKALSVPGTTVNGIEAHFVLGQQQLTFCWDGSYPQTLNPNSVAVDASSKVYVGGTSTDYTHIYDMSSFTPGVEQPVYDYILYDSASGMDYNSTEGYLYMVEGISHRGLIYDTSIFDGTFQSAGAGNRFNGFGRVDPAGDFVEESANDENNGPNDVGLDLPTGVVYDEDENWLFVSDFDKQRVIAYDRDDVSGYYYHADKVIGQSSFFAWNTSGLNTPSDNNVAHPGGMAIGTISGVKYLFVADTTYNRVLVFNLSDGLNAVSETAVYVLGQADFVSMVGAAGQAGLNGPTDLAFDDVNDILFIADNSNNRVIVHDFGISGLSDARMADNVFGQADFISNGLRDIAVFGGQAIENTLTISVDEDGEQLFVGGTSRVLAFDYSGGLTDDPTALNVFGATGLTTIPSPTPGSPNSSEFFTPKGLAYDSNKLYVSDSTNNRVLIFDTEIVTDGEAAENVLGQSDFTSDASATSQSGLSAPYDVHFSAEDDYLYVVDQDNDRVMVFSATFGPTAPTSCSIDSYTNSSATLSWTDNSSDEDSFTLEKSTDNVSWSSAGTANSNTTTGTATGLTAGELYYFRVKATNVNGDSSPASCGSQTLPANNAPDSITITSIDDEATAIPLTGQAFEFSSFDSDEDIFYYRFEITTDDTFLRTQKYWDQRDSVVGWPETFYEGSSPGSTTFTLPDSYALTPNTTYYWRVRSFDVFGAASDYSTPRSFTTISSSEEEADNVPYTALFNGESYSSSSRVNFAESNGGVTLQAINLYDSSVAALGDAGTTYNMDVFDADSDGDLDVIGGQDGSGVYIYINDGSGNFTQGSEIDDSDSFGVGDMDNDGDLDVVTTIKIYLNDGSGDFSSSSSYSGGGDGVSLGDLDGDGFVDIFVYASDRGSKIYINDGDGTFTEDTPSFFTSTLPATHSADSASLADFNGDSRVDIALFTRDTGPGTTPAYLLLNDGGVSFTESVLVSAETMSMTTVSDAFAVDIDDDGDQDLLISNVGLYLNNGMGDFTEASDMPFDNVSDYSCDVGLNHADMDGDGDQDVMCASSYNYEYDTNAYTTGQNYIFKNKGDGTFSDGVALGGTGRNTGQLMPADVDGDGDVDLIESNGGVGWNQDTQQNYIYINSGSFDLVEKAQYAFTITKIFDADNDGDMDLWGLGNSTSRILKINNGSGDYTVTEFDDTYAISYETLSVDVDGDGFLDIVEANRNATNSLWLNNGSGGFSFQTNPFGATAGYYHDAVAADIDGDGDNDILFSEGENGNAGQVELWLNDGSGDFSAATDPFGASTNENIFNFDAGDVDDDGDIDVLIPADTGAILYLNDGDGTFSNSIGSFGSSFGLGRLGDMDGDGRLDVVLHGTMIYLNQGGTFASTPIEIDSSLQITNGTFRLYDLDGDDDLDIVVGVEADSGGTNAIYRNYGNLSFVKEQGWFNNSDITRYLTMGDYDGDGDVDISVRNSSFYGSNFLYENRQNHTILTDYSLISGTVDSTSGDIYSATLTADLNDYVEYSISQVPLSYNGTDYDDYEDSENNIVNGGFLVFFSLEAESVPIYANDTDATDVLLAAGHSNYDLVLTSITYDDGGGEYTINETWFVKAGLFSSIAEVDTFLSDDDSYVSGGADLFVHDVFTYDSLTREYTYGPGTETETNTPMMVMGMQIFARGPTGVTPINTWQSGDPAITKTTVGTVEFDLYNGGGGEASAFSDVDTDPISLTSNINDLFFRDFGGGFEVLLAAGDNGLFAVQVAEDPWEEMPYDEPVSGPVDFNGVGINSSGDAIIVGDDGYIYFYSGDETVEEQICHVAGTPIYSNDLMAISVETDYAYVVGSSGLILNIDFTDQNNVSCTNESVGGVTATLNDVKTFDDGSSFIVIVGDSGTYISDFGVGTFTDNTVVLGQSEDLNGIAIGDEEVLIVGDNGLVVVAGDSIDVLDTGGTEDYYDGALSGETALVVGSSGGVYLTEDLLSWESFYVGVLSTISAMTLDSGEGLYIAGPDGLLKEYNGGEIEEDDWESVTSGTEYTFEAGGSDLRWRMVISTDSAYRTPVLNGVSISYSTTSAATDSGGTELNPPSQPVAERPDILSSTSIQWNFADTSDSETGFRFYDETSTLISEITESDLEYIVETGLLPNTSYQRYVTAINADGTSGRADLGTVYTLANIPAFEGASVISNSSLSLSIDEKDNSTETEYAIYEVGTQSWLNASGILGDVRVFQTKSDWLNGQSGITISGLTENAMYSFKVMAKNGDDVLTELSEAENIIVHTPVEANIIITKKVGVNVADEVVGVYFGKPVFAGTETAEKLKTIPLIANLANMYIAFTCFMMILFLFLVVLNASPCCKKVKHTHKLLFTDFRGRRGDDFYHALHGENAIRKGRVYNNHKAFYRFTNWGVIGVFFGLIVKVGVVLITAFIVYGGFQVHAFDNQSGEDIIIGDVLTYQVEYINNGDETATDVVITDVLPPEVSYVEGSLVSGEECSYDAGAVNCLYDAIAGNGEGIIEFEAVVTGAVGETVINIATATFVEGEDVVSSNSVSNEIVTNEIPVDCGAGETCDVTMKDGWNFFRMLVSSKVSFSHLEGSHAVELTSSNTVTDNIGLRITSDPVDVDLGAGVIADVDSDGNGLNDMKVKTQTIESDEIAVVGIMLVEEEFVAPICGDSSCNGGESCSTCPGDCGVCPPVEVCGNDVCGTGESCSNCPGDCGVCVDPPDPDPIDPVLPGNPGGATSECSDGLDNDADSLIDLSDPGCESAADNDEFNEISEEEKEDEELEDEVEEILESETTEKIVDTISTVVSGVSQEDIAEVTESVKESVAAVVRSTKKITSATIDNPVVEKVNDIAQEPVAVVATVSSVAAVATVGATGATGASLLTYLQFLFTQPLMLITRRKKRGWGVVYNSITKRATDLAIVRLYDYETKKLIQTRVTDKMGRYQFIVKPGQYFLEVSKKEHKYPSELLERAEIDGEYQGVYYGDPITVGEDGIINKPIPLDPDKKMESGKQVMRKLGWKKIQSLFTLLGPILAVISFIITPELWIGSLIVIQLVIYFVFKRLADAEKPVSWGEVKDALSGKALKRSVVRVFDKKYNKLLDTQVTERKGKYAFLVGNNEYYITTEKQGYQPHKTDVYDMSQETSGYLAKDIKMNKEGVSGGDHDGDAAVAVRSDLGRQTEVHEDGIKKVKRHRDEKFSGEIKDVELDDLHEDFYDVDSLRKK